HAIHKVVHGALMCCIWAMPGRRRSSNARCVWKKTKLEWGKMAVLHPADYAILAAYLVLTIAVCVRVTRRSPDADELFLAGRSLGWGVVGFSLFASNVSSTTLIGLPGAAWQSGIA